MNVVFRNCDHKLYVVTCYNIIKNDLADWPAIVMMNEIIVGWNFLVAVEETVDFDVL